MNDTYQCQITDTPIQLNDALHFLASPAHGAHCHFIGTVRNHNEGKAVKGIEYEVCQPLAINILTDIALNIVSQYKTIKIFIAHIEGYVPVGEIGMLVSTSTPHRDETYRANRTIVEAIKHRCPVWKKEFYLDNTVQWVKGCEINYAAC